MEKRNKIISLVLISACAIFVFCAVFFFFTGRSVKKSEIMLQGRLESLLSEKEKLTEAIKELESAKKDMGLKLKYSEEITTMLSSQLNEEKEKNTQCATKIGEQEMEITKLKSAIAKYKEDNENLSKRNTLLSEAVNGMKVKYDELSGTKEESEKMIGELNKKIKALSKEKGTTSLGTLVVR